MEEVCTSPPVFRFGPGKTPEILTEIRHAACAAQMSSGEASREGTLDLPERLFRAFGAPAKTPVYEGRRSLGLSLLRVFDHVGAEAEQYGLRRLGEISVDFRAISRNGTVGDFWEGRRGFVPNFVMRRQTQSLSTRTTALAL